MNSRDEVLVRWRISGVRLIGGKAYRRAVGDEDLMTRHEAKSYIACGMAEIVERQETDRVAVKPEDLGPLPPDDADEDAESGGRTACFDEQWNHIQSEPLPDERESPATSATATPEEQSVKSLEGALIEPVTPHSDPPPASAQKQYSSGPAKRTRRRNKRQATTEPESEES